MRALAAVLPALLLGACLPAAANNAEERGGKEAALALLEKVANSARQTTYAGTVLHLAGDRASSTRVTHLFIGGVEHERIEWLDGPRREVLRRGDELQCLYPDEKTIRMDKRVTARFFPSLLTGTPAAIAENYKLTLGKVERVAGQECQWILLDPRDMLRYAQRLCAEIATGLLLRARTLGTKGETLEQYTFTDVRLGPQVARSELRSTFQAQSKDWRRDNQSLADARAVPTGWGVERLPSGFTLVGEMLRKFPNRPHPVSQLMYSDGLATMSVFVEPMPTPARSAESLEGEADLSIFARPMGDSLVTVIGEVPPAAALQVGRSVQRRP